MGKKSPKDKNTRTPKQKRRSRSSANKYLKPGALAQLRYSKASAANSCTDLGKKRIGFVDAKKTENDGQMIQNKVGDKTPLMLSPVDLRKQNSLVRTPITPRTEECQSESRLECLPIELLVKILCHLHHDQLKAVFHVSQRIRKAVVIARQFHFNYTTPDRSRQEMLMTMTPRPTEHWPFVKGDRKGVLMPSPHTPKAPRHGARPPSRMKASEMRRIAAVLFQDSAFPTRHMVPPVVPKPPCKPLASNRVLFYEDELCQAVAQNKLH
ncbi:F-box family protein [Tripterygium wilfordii]|uniref:F-box family protein n=1 Tax=Tripterygium wilfordii TaxID=458696 RepID=A0A7J7CW03_TRIWF|nr:F-box protein At4g35930-like [Tripterygium wilfordii]KAF5738109.1 F-box family protein [Tripterygium wilfordii]